MEVIAVRYNKIGNLVDGSKWEILVDNGKNMGYISCNSHTAKWLIITGNFKNKRMRDGITTKGF